VLTPLVHHGRDPHGEKRPYVLRHLARLALAVTTAKSARVTSAACALRGP